MLVVARRGDASRDSRQLSPSTRFVLKYDIMIQVDYVMDKWEMTDCVGSPTAVPMDMAPRQRHAGIYPRKNFPQENSNDCGVFAMLRRCATDGKNVGKSGILLIEKTEIK
jgi:hypothetical protein